MAKGERQVRKQQKPKTKESTGRRLEPRDLAAVSGGEKAHKEADFK